MVWNIWIIFPYIGNVIIPTDELIFFRGVETTNQYFTVPIFTIFFTYLYLFKEKKTISLILKYIKTSPCKAWWMEGIKSHIFGTVLWYFFSVLNIRGMGDYFAFSIRTIGFHCYEFRTQSWVQPILILPDMYMFVIVWSNFLNCQRFFRVWSKTPSESKNEFRLLSRSARLANQNRSPSWAMLCLECGPSVGGGNEPSP